MNKNDYQEWQMFIEINRKALRIKGVAVFIGVVVFWIVLILLLSRVEASDQGGVDFSYLGGIATTLKRTTQQYVANVQAKNKEQAQAAYEMIQQILRDLPDTARNRELMDEYYSLIEKIRATGEASLEIRKRLSELTSTQGAHIKTESVVRVNAY